MNNVDIAYELAHKIWFKEHCGEGCCPENPEPIASLGTYKILFKPGAVEICDKGKKIFWQNKMFVTLNEKYQLAIIKSLDGQLLAIEAYWDAIRNKEKEQLGKVSL